MWSPNYGNKKIPCSSPHKGCCGLENGMSKSSVANLRFPSFHSLYRVVFSSTQSPRSKFQSRCSVNIESLWKKCKAQLYTFLLYYLEQAEALQAQNYVRTSHHLRKTAICRACIQDFWSLAKCFNHWVIPLEVFPIGPFSPDSEYES